MASNRYEYSDQVKKIFHEIREMERAIENAKYCLKHPAEKKHVPMLERAYRAAVWTSLYEIGRLIDEFITEEKQMPVFADPTVGKAPEEGDDND